MWRERIAWRMIRTTKVGSGDFGEDFGVLLRPPTGLQDTLGRNLRLRLRFLGIKG